jgi:uncharacterized protein
MALLVNLKHVESKDITLKGEISATELDMQTLDEAIRFSAPLEYDILVQTVEDGLLAQGRLKLALDCTCVRCLKTFRPVLELKQWAAHLPLKGDEAVPVVNDCVDLTPQVREDILLELPQHPLCEPGCAGLPRNQTGVAKDSKRAPGPEKDLSAWEELNKLRF